MDFIFQNMGTEGTFLGPWCFTNNSFFKVEDLPNHKILKEAPWNPLQNRIHQKYCDQLFHRTLIHLVPSFNKGWDRQFSHEFWELAIGKWLHSFICFYYQKFLLLKNIESQIEGQALTVGMFDQTFCQNYKLKNYTDFVVQYWNHEYNLVIFSEILRSLKPDNISFVEYSETNHKNYHKFDEDHLTPIDLLTKQPVIKNIFKLFKEPLKQIDYSPSVFLGNIRGLERRDKIYLGFTLFPGLGFSKYEESPRPLIPFSVQKDAFENFSAENEFERILAKNILHHIPEDFCWTYSHPSFENKRIKNFLGEDINDFPKSLIPAHIFEYGGRVHALQHGGGYGIIHSMHSSYVELNSPQTFISWGCSYKILDGQKSKLIATDSPYLSTIVKKQNKFLKKNPIDSKILFVTNQFSLYPGGLNSYDRSEDQLKMLFNLQDFFKQIPEDIKNRVYLKLPQHDIMYDHLNYFKRNFPPNNLLNYRKNLIDLLPDFNLVIVDNLLTSVLELMALDQPTLIWLDENRFPTHPDFAPIKKALLDAGILHTDLTSLLKKVSLSIHQGLSWWTEPNVLQAKSQFTKNYCRHSPDWKINLKLALKKQY